MERAAREEALHSLAVEVLEYVLPDQEDQFLLESHTALFSPSKRAFIVWGAKDVPPLPSSGDDLFVVVTGKRTVKDPRAVRSLQFPKLKAYPDNNEVLRWILKEGERFNIDLSRIAGALFVNSGNCLRKLSSEIEKLSMAVPEGTVVSPEDARALMCFSAELSPKEIVDSICDGQTVKALAFYDRLQDRGDETGLIIAYMQRHVVQQLKLEVLVDRGYPDDVAAVSLGMPIFVFQKTKASRKGLWSKESLKMSLMVLGALDIAHKRGKEFVRSGLESEIIRLSEEARNVGRR